VEKGAIYCLGAIGWRRSWGGKAGGAEKTGVKSRRCRKKKGMVNKGQEKQVKGGVRGEIKGITPGLPVSGKK